VASRERLLKHLSYLTRLIIENDQLTTESIVINVKAAPPCGAAIKQSGAKKEQSGAVKCMNGAVA
jgi:hypothetical protein